jgi:ABC-2 type transport system permease protein
MVLLRQQLRSDRWTIVTWCLTVVFLTWMTTGLYQVLNDTGTLTEFQKLVESMPAGVRALFGSQGFDMFGSFVASIEYGTMMAIAFMVFLATYVPGLISKEIDQRSSEFLLALPVKRSGVLGARWLGLAITMAIMTAVQWLTLVAVTGAQAEPVRYLWASINMYLLFLEVGTLLLLVSIFVDDYPKAAAVCAGLVVLLFFYNGMTENSTGLTSSVRKALPFARFDSQEILTGGGIPGADLALLAAGIAVLFFLAIRAFDAKQVAG